MISSNKSTMSFKGAKRSVTPNVKVYNTKQWNVFFFLVLLFVCLFVCFSLMIGFTYTYFCIVCSFLILFVRVCVCVCVCVYRTQALQKIRRLSIQEEVALQVFQRYWIFLCLVYCVVVCDILLGVWYIVKLPTKSGLRFAVCSLHCVGQITFKTHKNKTVFMFVCFFFTYIVACKFSNT